jgi:hypothetical protein
MIVFGAIFRINDGGVIINEIVAEACRGIWENLERRRNILKIFSNSSRYSD